MKFDVPDVPMSNANVAESPLNPGAKRDPNVSWDGKTEAVRSSCRQSSPE